MDDYELITVGEMDGLPDDPQEAFVMFEGICRRRMNAYINNIGQNDPANPDEIRIEYMTRIGAAAAAYGIIEIDADDYSEFTASQFTMLYRKAVAIVTRLNIEKRQRQKGSIVALSNGTKERLKKHLQEMRTAVTESDLEDKRKRILSAKLDAFAKELDREKSNINVILVAVSIVAAGLNQGMAGVEKAQKILIDMPKTIQAVNILLGKESLHEQEQGSLPAPPEIKSLHSARQAPSPPPPSFADDLDDDVPF